MQLRILKGYHDVELARGLSVGEIIDVSEERARTLLAHPQRIVEALQPFQDIENAEFREATIEPTLEAPLKSPETFDKPVEEKTYADEKPTTEGEKLLEDVKSEIKVEKTQEGYKVSKKKDKKKVRKYKGAKK